MYRVVHVFAVLVITLLGGCVQFPAAQPESVRASGYSLTTVPDSAPFFDHTTKPVDSSHSVIYSQTGGGSLALGLVLPFGRYMNVNAIDKRTDKEIEALRGHINIDAAALFTQAAADQGLMLASDSSTSAMPFVQFTKTTGDTDTVRASAVVMLQAGEASKNWRGRYVYQLPDTYTYSDLTMLDEAGSQAISQAAAIGFHSLAKYLHDENSAKQASERKIIVSSPLLFPSVPDVYFHAYLIDETNDMIWLRATSGVYALRKSDVKYKIQ